MLMPRKVKHRKHQRGRMNGMTKGGSELAFGEYGIQALEPGWITARQIEAARIAMTRHIKRGGKVWINVFPDKPVTKKPAETRMGSGKGNPEFWVAVVKPGRVMFELSYPTPDIAKAALERAIQKLPAYERVSQGLAYVPQGREIFPLLTVEENLLAVLEGRALSEPERRRQLEQLIDEFRLNAIARQKAFTLSGGERRRVEVARALALDPVFLLLDEPFAGIDPIAVGEIQRMMEVLRKRGIGILITDHNVRETLTICDSAYLLGDGRILEKGTPKELVESPVARERYLGEDFRF